MAREPVKKIKRELIEEQDEFYGEENVGGSQTGLGKDDDTKGTLEKTVGTNIGIGKPFSLAEEVDKDEDDRRGPKNKSSK